jgi:hypothetical protein
LPNQLPGPEPPPPGGSRRSLSRHQRFLKGW